jgi:hypothetical protein
MPTSKHPLRHPRRPQFSAETLDLFRELNATARRRRKAPEFIAKSKRLGVLLGLSDAWWMMLHVENANVLRPCPTLAAYEWWPRVQAVRAALLAALKRSTREAQPVDEKARPAP